MILASRQPSFDKAQTLRPRPAAAISPCPAHLPTFPRQRPAGASYSVDDGAVSYGAAL